MGRTKSVPIPEVQELFAPGSSVDELIHLLSSQLDALIALQDRTAVLLIRLREIREKGLDGELLQVERFNPVTFYAGYSITLKL